MLYDPLKHHRRSIRLRGYDYAAEGAYSVTICTRNRECTLGGIADRGMILSEIGRIADECWLTIPNDLQNAELDEYQIMPNHVHGIVVIWDKRVKIGDENSLRDLMGKGESAGDLMAGEHSGIDVLARGCSVRDLINQIPPGNRISLGFVHNKFTDDVDWPLMKNPKNTLGKIIRHFKAKASKTIHNAGFYDFEWQKGYYDHIIRDNNELERVRQYIRNNPRRWSESKKRAI